MSIYSTAFGVTKLTKQDSDKFRRQVSYGRPSKAAVIALKEGRRLLMALDKHGSVTVKIKSK